ncbi:hypothetical protein [Anatilimnocola floriformis]|uniref:hypothetical protein n=1 Tax=Anatilimnocola floriformis TaxID=2948575 RepID=UPI0020C20AE4|nr:hypothetical protein [Anatilimnocola floriformis]
MNSDADRPSIPFLATLGLRLLVACIGALVVGNFVVRLAFPQLLGKGLTPTALMILIPIWTVGVTGLAFLLLAWIYDPYPNLPPGYLGLMPDFELSLLVRVLIAVVLAIFSLASLLLVTSTEEKTSTAFRLGFAYLVLTIVPFIFFLMFRYDGARHPAMQTYLVYLGPLLGIGMIPIAWPLHFILHWLVRNEIARRESRQRFGPYDR